MRMSLFLLVVLIAGCTASRHPVASSAAARQTKADNYSYRTTIPVPFQLNKAEFLVRAEAFEGIPYQYGSANPSKGLDCSGFIFYLFGKYGKAVPRTSRDFTLEGIDIKLREVVPGDFLLFTGSDNSSGIVGHMGIVVKNLNRGDNITFIHSASKGVIISTLTGYWKEHFVKAIRLIE